MRRLFRSRLAYLTVGLLLAATIASGQARMVTTTGVVYVRSLSKSVYTLGTTVIEDAVNILAQKNGSAAQTYRLYGNATDYTAWNTDNSINLNWKVTEATPAAPSAALAGAGAGNVDNGTHVYQETCVGANGETTPSASSASVNVVDKTTNGKVTVTLVACTKLSTGRNLYRSKAGTTTPLFLVAASPVVSDPATTTTYTDNIADASLQAGAPPTSNADVNTPWQITNAGALSSTNFAVNSSGAVTKVGGITTTANGVSSIVAQGRLTAQTGAVASVATYTPTVDGSYLISADVLVTASATHNFSINVTYTDEGNTARTQSVALVWPTTNTGFLISNTGGTVTYSAEPIQIRVKANTAITVVTAGTFTSVTYNVEATIQRLTS